MINIYQVHCCIFYITDLSVFPVRQIAHFLERNDISTNYYFMCHKFYIMMGMNMTCNIDLISVCCHWFLFVCPLVDIGKKERHTNQPIWWRNRITIKNNCQIPEPQHIITSGNNMECIEQIYGSRTLVKSLYKCNLSKSQIENVHIQYPASFLKICFFFFFCPLFLKAINLQIQWKIFTKIMLNIIFEWFSLFYLYRY